MIILNGLRRKLREEYPEATDEQIERAAEEALEKLQEAADEVDGEEVMREMANAPPSNDIEGYDDVGTYGVMIMSQRDEQACEACLDHDGTQYTIEETLDEPPLPHDECENDECRCSMLPIPDRETYLDMLDEEPDLSNLYD